MKFKSQFGHQLEKIRQVVALSEFAASTRRTSTNVYDSSVIKL